MKKNWKNKMTKSEIGFMNKIEKTIFVIEIKQYDCEGNYPKNIGYACITEEDIDHVIKKSYNKNIQVILKKESIKKVQNQISTKWSDYCHKAFLLSVDDMRRIKKELESELQEVRQRLKAFNTFSTRYNL